MCPYCRLLAPIQSGLFELRLDPYRKDRAATSTGSAQEGQAAHGGPGPVSGRLRARHLDDFPWVEFVHRGKTDCRYELRLYELGASGEVADIQVQCVKCESKRRLCRRVQRRGQDGTGQSARGGGRTCASTTRTPARGEQRAILLGASNSWFPIMLSVLSIPTTTDKLGPAGRDELGRAGRSASRARDVKLKRKLLRGLADLHRGPDLGGRRQAEGGQRAAGRRDSSICGSPSGQVFSNPDPSLNSRDFKLRVVEPPKAYRQSLDESRPGRAAARGPIPDRLHPDRVAG